jgi:secreted trypsin-like serine protease
LQIEEIKIMKQSVKIQKMMLMVIVTTIALSLMIVLPAKAITWGELDTEHTNVGAMVVDWPDNGLSQVCSGTLIEVEGLEGRVFLTAGHCTDYLQYLLDSGQITIDDIYVNFDVYALEESTLLPVAEVETHPDYSWTPASNRHDVGLLLLEENSGLTPASLPEKGFLDARKKAGDLRQGKEEADFIVVGYGGTLDWPPPSVSYENMRQFAESEYQALTRSWLHMSQNHATGDGGTCYGDSGGPTFWIDPDTGDETDIVVAITSWGDVPCVATGIAYRVDTSDALDFIAKKAEEWLDE